MGQDFGMLALGAKLPRGAYGRIRAGGLCWSLIPAQIRLTSSEFLDKFESGVLGDDQGYFVWWSLIRGLEAIRARKDS
jgi:hypothetical protein